MKKYSFRIVRSIDSHIYEDFIIHEYVLNSSFICGDRIFISPTDSTTQFPSFCLLKNYPKLEEALISYKMNERKIKLN